MTAILVFSLCCFGITIILLMRQVQLLKSQTKDTPTTNTQHNFELLAAFSHPVLIANGAGKILYTNEQWKKLPLPYAQLQNLSEFDYAAGTRLTGRMKHSIGNRTFTLKLPTTTHQNSVFSAVTWPISTPSATNSIALALFPQELAEARGQEYPRLERELLVFSRKITGKAKESLRAGKTLESYQHLEELSDVLGYVYSHHTALRTQQPYQSVDLAAVWRTVLPRFRPQLRNLGFSVTGTVSHDSLALGSSVDVELFITILLEYITAGEPFAKKVPLHIYQHRQGENQIFEVETEQIPSSASLQHFRLRLLHQLAVKLGGHFDASGAPHPRYRLRLRAEKTPKLAA